MESPDDIPLYRCENNCVCLCAYEIGGVEGGEGDSGVDCRSSDGVRVSPNISFSKQQAF